MSKLILRTRGAYSTKVDQRDVDMTPNTVLAFDAQGQPMSSPGGVTGKTTYVDAVYGSDITGSRQSSPFKTITAAMAAAVSGDLVVVRSGTYAEGITLVDGVSLHLSTGVTINAPQSALNAAGTLTCQVTGDGIINGGGGGVGLLVAIAGTVSVRCRSITGPNGAFFGAGGGGTVFLEVTEPIGVNNIAVSAGSVTTKCPLMGGQLAVSGGATLRHFGNINTAGIGVNVNTAGKLWVYGDIISQSDSVHVDGAGSEVRVLGDCESHTDAALWSFNGGLIICYGHVRCISSTGFWQLCGSGAGVWCNGGDITVYGDVKGIMPVICGTGTVDIWGDVIVDTGPTPSYSAYGASGGSLTDPSCNINVFPEYNPTDIASYLQVGVIALIDGGLIKVRGRVVAPTAQAVRVQSGEVQVYDRIQSTFNNALGVAAMLNGGKLKVKGGTEVVSHTTAATSVRATTTGGSLTVVAATDVWTSSVLHNLATGQAVLLATTTTLPAGFATATTYYARAISTTTFTLHATRAGALANTGIVDATDTGTGTHSIALNLAVAGHAVTNKAKGAEVTLQYGTLEVSAVVA